MLNKINNNYMKGNHDESVPSGNGQQNASRSKTQTTQFIDCEVLFFTYSNLHRMKLEIMNNGTTSQKIFCPTVQDIENVMSNAVIKTKARQIYIQCGTNDLEEPGFDKDNMIEGLITKIKSNFDEPEIVISSILPRKNFQSRE